MSDQVAHLPLEFEAGTIVVDHDVGTLESGGPVGLTVDAGARIVFGEATLFDEPLDRAVRVDVDDDEQVEIVAPRFDQKRDVQNHRFIGGPDRIEPSLDLGADRRVHDRVEPGEQAGIRKYPVGKSLPVQVAGRQENLVTELGDNRDQHGLSRLLELVGDRIGIDDDDPVVGEDARHRCLAATDTAGESDEAHRYSEYPAPVRLSRNSGGSRWLW